MSFVITASADNCPVCLEACNNQDNGEAMAHDGVHAIHEVCLRNLLANDQFKCPLCRVAITHISGENIQPLAVNAVNPREDLSEQAVAALVAQNALEAENNQALMDGYIPNIDPVTGLPND